MPESDKSHKHVLFVMSIKYALSFSYTARIYSALISVVVTPLYLDRVGVEGFGLMGFFLMLQGWIAIIDAGISGSLSRQISITKSNKEIFVKFLKQFYLVVIFFICIAFLFIVFGYLSKHYIAVSWLNSQLDLDVLETSVFAMLITLAIRYLCGPFQSGLVGLEKHGVLSVYSVIFATIKFPLGLFVLDYYNNSLTNYFIYQGCVSFLELFVVILLFVNSSRKVISFDSVSSG